MDPIVRCHLSQNYELLIVITAQTFLDEYKLNKSVRQNIHQTTYFRKHKFPSGIHFRLLLSGLSKSGAKSGATEICYGPNFNGTVRVYSKEMTRTFYTFSCFTY
jgi:hypothetical protein